MEDDLISSSPGFEGQLVEPFKHLGKPLETACAESLRIRSRMEHITAQWIGSRTLHPIAKDYDDLHTLAGQSMGKGKVKLMVQ